MATLAEALASLWRQYEGESWFIRAEPDTENNEIVIYVTSAGKVPPQIDVIPFNSFPVSVVKSRSNRKLESTGPSYRYEGDVFLPVYDAAGELFTLKNPGDDLLMRHMQAFRSERWDGAVPVIIPDGHFFRVSHMQSAIVFPIKRLKCGGGCWNPLLPRIWEFACGRGLTLDEENFINPGFFSEYVPPGWWVMDLLPFDFRLRKAFGERCNSFLRAKYSGEKEEYKHRMNYYANMLINGMILDSIAGPSADIDRAWITATTKALAAEMIQSGDYSMAGILADALEDAGCTNPLYISRLRFPMAPLGEGDWLIDRLAGMASGVRRWGAGGITPNNFRMGSLINPHHCLCADGIVHDSHYARWRNGPPYRIVGENQPCQLCAAARYPGDTMEGGQRRTLLDDSDSGGIEIAPIIFDESIVRLPIFYEGDFPSLFREPSNPDAVITAMDSPPPPENPDPG